MESPASLSHSFPRQFPFHSTIFVSNFFLFFEFLPKDSKEVSRNNWDKNVQLVRSMRWLRSFSCGDFTQFTWPAKLSWEMVKGSPSRMEGWGIAASLGFLPFLLCAVYPSKKKCTKPSGRSFALNAALANVRLSLGFSDERNWAYF